MTDSPLEQAELVYRVGWFLTLWVPHETRKGRYHFYPEDLLSCIQVNKRWLRTLSPLLWMVYDHRNERQKNAPPNLIEAHSPRFRYLSVHGIYPGRELLASMKREDRFGTHYPQLGLIHSTNLRELRFDSPPSNEAIDLIHRNPCITMLYITLHWVDPASKVLQRALESLPNLRVLILNGGEDINNNWIAKLLEHVSGLEELELYGFDNLMPYQDPRSFLSLIFDIQWYLNLGRVPQQPLLSFVQVVRLCPQLEALAFRAHPHVSKYSLSGELSNNLRECCPRLNSLRYLDRSLDWQHLREGDQVALLQSTPHLVHYDAPIRDFNSGICQSLLDPHARWLETIRIRVHVHAPYRFSMASRILASCLQLSIFELDTVHVVAEDILGVFEQPWECPSLRLLKLTGFSNDFSADLRARVALSGYSVQSDSETEQEDGSESETDFDSGQETDDEIPTVLSSPWTRVYAEHPEPNPEFHENLASRGWIRSKLHVHVSEVPSRLEKIVQQTALERLSGSTRIQRVTLEGYVFARTR
ncbi:hypothetical protein CPB97_003213 [Podila verticillata]|nr:hypothetical protein CPB97_003213 [Podila verticillata]